MRSSSRRQDASPEIHHAKSIGCMSGIIHLFSKYQNPNRRLTFGRKHEKRKTMPSPTKVKRSTLVEVDEKRILETDKVICGVEVRRSPTIPPEIRRSNSVSSPDDARTRCSLVARLMGLEDASIAAETVVIEEIDSISTKRRRLLQALEKCNEDLDALKRIIKALQAANVRLVRPSSDGGNECSFEVGSCVMACTDVVADAPNVPVGTLDLLARSPRGGASVALETDAGNACTRVVHVALNQPHKPEAAKKAGAGNNEQLSIAKLLRNNSTTFAVDIPLLMRRRPMAAGLPTQSSKAMVWNVEQVCYDIAWGKRTEINNIGHALEDDVCRELIEELVKEMKESCSVIYYNNNNNVHHLPLEACKRRLCFYS